MTPPRPPLRLVFPVAAVKLVVHLRETFVAYAAALGNRPKSDEKKDMGPLPQFYADMFGWREMTATVARVAASLSPDERAHAVIRANDYGQAGAFEYFDPTLPPVACGHNNYWLWGPPQPDPQLEIRLGHDDDAEFWRREVYADCEDDAVFEDPWVMPFENHLHVYVCRHPRESLEARWPQVKHYE